MSTLPARSVVLRIGTMTVRTRHKPGIGCTAECKPEVLPISLEGDATWLVHWPHEHPEVRTACGWVGVGILDIPTADLPSMDNRVGCPDCFDQAGDDVLARWLA